MLNVILSTSYAVIKHFIYNISSFEEVGIQLFDSFIISGLVTSMDIRFMISNYFGKDPQLFSSDLKKHFL